MPLRETHRMSLRFFVIAVTLIALMVTSGATLAKVNQKSVPKESELNTIRGVVKPAVKATVSSEIQAHISQLPFKDGQRFKKGDTLVKFDCSKYKAELAAANAEHEARQKTLDNNIELSKLNAIGQLEVEIAKANVKKALAAIKIAKVSVDRCRINAPFSGRVVKTMVNQYESVNPYDELISILDDSRLEIELILPSKALLWLKKGAKFKFVIDETSQTYPAKVREIGASVDPVSQTIRLIGEFKSAPKRVLAGMSGSAKFPAIKQQGEKMKKQGIKKKSKKKVKKAARTKNGTQQTTAKR